MTGTSVDPAFWNSRRVLITGHTGFKGSWLALWLQSMGAEVTGLARGVPSSPSHYDLARVGEGMAEVDADIRDPGAVRAAVAEASPEVVLHLAAQPLVRLSFTEPLDTYATNVMGTAHVLDAVRLEGGGVRAVVNVTSDKCYDNREQGRPFVETDPMGGHDPYSNSKGCAELVADAYRRSFFSPDVGSEVGLASARAGNVIGGGDWGADRLIPDVVRAAASGSAVAIRNPEAIRPWQHVLNPLSGYLLLAQRAWDDPAAAAGWNFGPAAEDVRPVRWIADELTRRWPGELRWEFDEGPHPHEAQYLALDSTRARTELGWAPRWDLGRALEAIVDWHARHAAGEDMRAVTLRQIEEFAG